MINCKMNPFFQALVDNLQAQECASNGNTSMQFSDSILDLSFKKATISKESENSSSHSHSNSLVTNTTKQDKVKRFSETGKSPSEVQKFMITPTSECDSPKKIKYEPVQNLTDTSLQNGGFPTSPMNISIPLIPTILSTLLNTDNEAINSTQLFSPPATLITDSNKTTLCDLPIDIAKNTRPFKAYPIDPLSLTTGRTELLYDLESSEAYSEFRKRMLETMKQSNEGTITKMRKVTRSPVPTSTADEKDAAYRERRRKNNEAAKRSRDARRAKEDEIAIRAAFLEHENKKLKYEISVLKNETAKLMAYLT
ncbi:thyrotroph embryonic factor [Bombus pyrosoma]|uniref:thyrotroph embryonic factor n=1 Tax=Bombus pyrosoma TaxID=396416 RepID=UPI001CB8F6B0|nr:thyrotroph embryonic factor [Bombus pyrosoma]